MSWNALQAHLQLVTTIASCDYLLALSESCDEYK